MSLLILQPLAYIKEGNRSGVVYQRYKCSLDILLKEKVSEENKRLLLGQLDNMMVELWTLHWAHGDIKPGNILVDHESKLILGDSDDMCQTSLMNPNYSVTKRYHPVYYNAEAGERKEVDLWSFGIIFYEILAGESISNAGSHADVVKMLGDRACLVSKTTEARADYVKKLINGTQHDSTS